MEKHQFGFALMNDSTGGQRRISFWGVGENVEECRKNAMAKAKAKCADLAEAYYQRQEAKNRSCYRLSRSSYTFSVVGCSLWQ
jgi:hypothetical protein